MHLPHHSTLLFIGDSITDTQRGPTGEVSRGAPNANLGFGYVSIVWAALTAGHPDAGIRVVNKGLSGNTVRDLESRWNDDVIAYQPEVLCIMIGINDVWRQFDNPLRPDTHIDPDCYRETLRRLIRSTTPAPQQLYLATPFFIEPNPTDPMRARMDAYGDIVRAIATEHNATLVDTQAAFAPMLQHMHPCAIAADRVHPGMHGHMAIAKAFLNAFGC